MEATLVKLDRLGDGILGLYKVNLGTYVSGGVSYAPADFRCSKIHYVMPAGCKSGYLLGIDTTLNKILVYVRDFVSNPGALVELSAAKTDITKVSLTTNVVTITAANTLKVGQKVKVAAVTNTDVNGTFAVKAATATTFTYDLTHADIAEGADTGTVSVDPDLSAVDTFLIVNAKK